MEKVIKFLRNSVLLGLAIAIVIDIVADFKFFNNINLYMVSVTISIITGAAIEYMYKKIIIRKNISEPVKILSVYGVTGLIYTCINIVFLGTSILTSGAFYLYAFIILALVTPMYFFVNRQMQTYDQHLKNKKKSIHL